MRNSVLLFVLLLMCCGIVFADSHDGDGMSMGFPHAEGGVAAVPVGADGPGPAVPGRAYSFVVHANEGDTLTFATMLAQSNDGFLAPNEYGIALYDMDAAPIRDVTDQVYYWDLGTERNEPIGRGHFQAPRQTAPNTGPAGDGMVRLTSDLGDNMSYPTANELVRVTLTKLVNPSPSGGQRFIVRIVNVSDTSMYPSPITPIFWVVQSADDMMMMDDMMMKDMMMDDDMMDDDMDKDMSDDEMMDDDMDKDRSDDEMMDDDMDKDMSDDDMSDDMDDMSDDDMMEDDMSMMKKHGFLFTSGSPDYGHGLESLAEDGDPSALAAYHGIHMDDMMMGEM
ncbi:MAG: spondin domain-containing protein [Chloroflexota bacterium]|nr:spondin domain-containing protein [Chloroflexota bacterium]MDE2910078.1 spondin domain-containing protein [Chloroflexota bacterium]